LLDVQLDEHPDPAHGLVIRADALRVMTRGGHRLSHGDAISVAKTSGHVGVEPAGDQTGSGAGDSETRAFLVDEVRDTDGTRWHESPGPQGINDGQRGDDSQRTVKRAAVRN